MKLRYVWVLVVTIILVAITSYFLFPGSFLAYTICLILLVGILLWRANRFLWLLLDKEMPWERYGKKRFFIHLVLGYILSIGIVNVCYLILRLAMISTPPSLSQILTTNLFGALLFIPVFSMYFSIQFLNYWRKSQVEMEIYQKESIRSELRNLKNHLDPHFLFNNLNILSALIDKDKESSKQFLVRFAQVYRKMLQSSSEDLISLEEELEFIESYTFLLDARFGVAMNVRMDVSDECRAMMLPPLTIQMLIENAVKHNIASEEDPLLIYIYSEGDEVLVGNNIREKQEDLKTKSGTGLKNIKDRIAYFTDRDLAIEKNENEFKVRIPLIEIEEV